ncbi:MAG: dihydroxyacetone kinase subunit DhaK [Chloroflexota bacterium]|nr:dihydroxyacetone kinase subunit DhaK [Chloroflexota bacterium]
MDAAAGDRIAVMVNGLGATPPEGLYVMYRRVHQILEGRQISVQRAYIGEHATSMEMAGERLCVSDLVPNQAIVGAIRHISRVLAEQSEYLTTEPAIGDGDAGITLSKAAAPLLELGPGHFVGGFLRLGHDPDDRADQ